VKKCWFNIKVPAAVAGLPLGPLYLLWNPHYANMYITKLTLYRRYNLEKYYE